MLPRLQDRGEHTTDHQIATANWLRAKPGIHVADRDADLGPRIAEAPGAPRRPRRSSRRPPGTIHRTASGSASSSLGADAHGRRNRLAVAGLGKMGIVAFRHRERASRGRGRRLRFLQDFVLDVLGRYAGVPAFRDYDAMLARPGSTR